MGWHAKPLPKDMAETVTRDLQSRILNSNKRLYPATPTEDAPPVSLRNIRMPSGPSYKPGEKVCAMPLCHTLSLSLQFPSVSVQFPFQQNKHFIISYRFER